MNQEVKALWVKALKSGKYRQGMTYLKQGVTESAIRYCCLGVLCELAKAQGIASEAKAEFSIYTFDGESGYLPASVQKWSGLSREDQRNLANMNDEGNTFVEIAHIIERFH